MRALFVLATSILVLAGCSAGGAAVPGSGANGQRSFTVGNFQRIDLAGPYNVIVRVGEQPSVRAEGDESALQHLQIRVEGDRLRIDVEPGSWTFNGQATVYVTAPTLIAAALAGSGNMQVGPFRSAEFEASVAGSGNLVMERLEGEGARFDIAGSGNVRAAGAVRQARLDVVGSGNGNLADLQTQDARISVAGSGDARIHATGRAAVSAAGSGNVTVTGGAHCEISSVGSARVNCS